MSERRVVVIGGGPAGLKAAHELAKAGAEVTLLESAPRLGGLASAFDVQGTRIERYYHFICKGDDDLVATLDELGLSHKFQELLEECARVRKELGYPIMITPFAQFVGIQAVLNIVRNAGTTWSRSPSWVSEPLM